MPRSLPAESDRSLEGHKRHQAAAAHGGEEVRDELEKSENTQYVAVIDRHVEELRDIEAARGRIKDRRFGICMAWSDIAFDRLLAYPTAKRCFACQQQRERLYVSPGVPTL